MGLKLIFKALTSFRRMVILAKSKMANPWFTFFKQLLLGKETKSLLMFNMRYGFLIGGVAVIFRVGTAEIAAPFYWILGIMAGQILLVDIIGIFRPAHLIQTEQGQLKASKTAALGSDKTTGKPEDTRIETTTPGGVEPTPSSEENA